MLRLKRWKRSVWFSVLNDFNKYKQLVDYYLDSIHVPVDALECSDYNCSNVDHFNAVHFVF